MRVARVLSPALVVPVGAALAGAVLVGAALVGAALVGAALVGAGPAQAAPAGGPAFGTGPVSAAGSAPAAVTAVEVGRHAGFDRVVFRLAGPGVGYTVRYEPRLVQDGSGQALPLAGSAVLVVRLQPTPWTERPSARADRTDGLPALRQVRSAGEFEGMATYGLGQAGRDGFRAFRLTGPDRVVVDLRHPTVPAPGTTPGASPVGTPAGTPAGTPTGTPTGTPAGTAAPESPATTPAAATDPDPADDGGFPLPAVLIGVMAAALLAAAALALRTRR